MISSKFCRFFNRPKLCNFWTNGNPSSHSTLCSFQHCLPNVHQPGNIRKLNLCHSFRHHTGLLSPPNSRILSCTPSARLSQTDSKAKAASPLTEAGVDGKQIKMDRFVAREQSRDPVSMTSSPRPSDYDASQEAPTTKPGFFAVLKMTPQPAMGLGLAGTIPFLAAPIYLIYLGQFDAFVANAQIFYGATIVSFVGGVRWGHSLLPPAPPSAENDGPTWRNLGYSVVPQLIAWVGLLVPFPASLGLVATGLFVATHLDLRHSAYPPWFKTLRLLLSTIVFVSLWTTFILGFSMPLTVKKVLDKRKAEKFSAKDHAGQHIKASESVKE